MRSGAGSRGNCTTRPDSRSPPSWWASVPSGTSRGSRRSAQWQSGCGKWRHTRWTMWGGWPAGCILPFWTTKDSCRPPGDMRATLPKRLVSPWTCVVGNVPRRMAPLAQSTMYRILQEALTNVARHAQARGVGVVLKHKDDVLEIAIRDNGVGFDPASALSEASGLGLHGMHERVALLGGSVQIASRRGHGTMIRARIPTGRIDQRASN